MKWLVFALMCAGCAGADLSTIESCEPCLSAGGTWQISACTEACAIQDISCFEDECPGACEAGACGNCFGQGECEAATCTWKVQDEAFWCAAS